MYELADQVTNGQGAQVAIKTERHAGKYWFDIAEEEAQEYRETEGADQDGGGHLQDMGGKAAGAFFAAVAHGAGHKTLGTNLLIAVIAFESGIPTTVSTWFELFERTHVS